MTGFLGGADISSNRIEALRASLRSYIDLTSANPTTQGQRFPADILARAAAPYWESRVYAPNPRGLLPARQAVAAFYAQRQPALVCDPELDIFLTASTSEAYVLLFGLLANPGDNILAPAVSYPLFEYLAALFQLELRTYPLDEARGWRIDPWQLGRLSDERTRAVLIVSPHNPTGAVVRTAMPVLQWMNVPIICDEVFAEFPYAVDAVPPLAALMPDLPIFTLNGLSKMYALPDMKLGWIALTAAARARYGERLEVMNDTLLGASGLIQTMLPALMRDGAPFVAQQRAAIRANLDAALTVLRTCPQVRVRPPDAGYYVFMECLIDADEEAVVLYLLAQGVLVYPGYFFGESERRYLAISCLVQHDVLLAGIQQMCAALARYPTEE
jgi:aspartate/methionine/tyrosine aminotransferase